MAHVRRLCKTVAHLLQAVRCGYSVINCCEAADAALLRQRLHDSAPAGGLQGQGQRVTEAHVPLISICRELATVCCTISVKLIQK